MLNKSFFRKSLAWVSALTLCATSTGMLKTAAETDYGTYGGFFGLEDTAIMETGNRITVDLNANDGRKASFARYADNWCVQGGSTATSKLSGLTYTLSNGGGASGDVRSVNNKRQQMQSGIYPYLTMDGVTIDNSSGGGILKLEIKGLSAGTHSLKTWHSCVDNATVGTMSITINGKKTASGVKCPTRVTDEDNAGMSYSTFSVSSGQTVTVLISPEGSGNAWLNAFEIDGGDPINGVSAINPADQDSHHDVEEGLSWKAGTNAKSHNVYLGTDYDKVFSATTSSSEYLGNTTGTSFDLDSRLSSVPTYYWRVDTVDSSGNVVKGGVHSFQLNRLAFPTAEGYGRYARGGRGGQVIHVTNLNDSGEGSLRWALTDEQWQTEDWKGVPRIIVFDVGGVISLQSKIMIPDNAGNVYVAGQTAPGDGITLINYDFGGMGTSDLVIRDIRVRVGDVSGKSTGGMGLASCNQSIIDHCSISWATDEGFSSRTSQNITFQWNIIGESLNESVHYNADNRNETEPHSFAASVSGYTGSFHHNLLINNTGRNWSLAGGKEEDGVNYGGKIDISNNVVYNWRDRTTDGGVKELNFVNNFYKSGPVSNENMHIVSTDGNELGYTTDCQKMYVSGNIMQSRSGSYLLKASDNAWDKGKAISAEKNCTTADVRRDSPFFENYINLETAENAYKSVIAGAGAGGTSATGWDYIDSRYIKEVTNGSYTYTGSKAGLKGIIDSQKDAGGYPTTSNFAHSTDGATNAKNDTDRDGMPNTWEEKHGLNPNDASDASLVSLSPDDYTNIEMYLNELAGDPVVYGTPVTPGKTGAVIDTAYEYTITNVGSGLQLEVEGGTAADGTDVQQGTTGANGWTLEDAGGGYYKIYSEVGDGKTYLLDLSMGAKDNGTNIGIWSDTASDAQLFKFVDNGDGTYTICTKATSDDSCIGIVSGSTEEGATAVQWACDGSDNQKWTLKVKLDPIEGTLIKELLPNDPKLYKYWSIDKSLAVGDLVFGDRDVTYKTVPEDVLGAELIVTPCDAKTITTDLATFTAGADITVYVALDARVITSAGAPSWLTGWENTGMSLINSKDVNFTLFAKDFDKGTTVTLGQNGTSQSCVNYTVLAMEQAEDPTEPPTTAPTEPVTTTAPITTTKPVTTTEPTTEYNYIPGDVNNDDVLNIFDDIALRRAIIDRKDLNYGEALLPVFSPADTDGNGYIEVADLVLLNKYLLGEDVELKYYGQ